MLNILKALIAIAVIAVAPAIPAQAQDSQKASPQAQTQAMEKAGAILCTAYEGLAGQIMENRQAQVDLSKMMSVAAGLDVPPEHAAFIKNMILEAYQSPAYESAEYQANAISEFKNRVSVACYNALMGITK